MGIDRRIQFAAGTTPSWDALRDLLAREGYPVQLRMIDNQLAFPDQQPPSSWRELRVGTPGGMVTLRREQETLTCVTWGNADMELLRAWNALAWACAQAGDGQVHTDEGMMNAARFRSHADLPEVLRPAASYPPNP